MHMAMPSANEGHIPVPGGWVWYRRVGQPDTVPLLVLHGGPGSGSDYLMSLASLASEREVIFFDQLGCGRSETPSDDRLWQIERFVTEVAAVRRALRLERFHLFGHSWGGWLAIEYLLTRPAGVVGLVLASTSASLPQYIHEVGRLREALPAPVRETLARYESEGAFDHLDYKAALLHFYQRHFCRLPVWPQVVIDNMRASTHNRVYTTMQGPNELTVTGTLKDWDRTKELTSLTMPTLVTVGRYDSATPACAATLQQFIANAELQVLQESAHLPHLEEEGRYMEVLRTFLQRVEGQAQ